MGTYVLTGGATGIGAAIKEKLRAQGHRVVVIDLKEGDYLADLGDPETRSSVVSKVADEVPEIDGLITCAGVASQFPNTGKILAINYFGTTEVIEGLSANVVTGGRIIAISSNSAPMSTRPDLIDALLDGPEAAAVAMGAELNGHECYASSKNAVARYMRRTAPILAQRGISFNALAPGYISTPPFAFSTLKQPEFKSPQIVLLKFQYSKFGPMAIKSRSPGASILSSQFPRKRPKFMVSMMTWSLTSPILRPLHQKSFR